MEKRTKWKKLFATFVFVVVWLITIIGAGICHLYIHVPVPENKVSIECINRVDTVGAFGFDASEIYFKITNNSNKALEKVDGTVEFFRKTDNKLLLRTNVNFSDFSNDMIEEKESEQFYLYLYDKSVDNHGVEGFYDVYNEDFSNLEIKFNIKSLELSKHASAYKTANVLSIILQIPTYGIVCFLLGRFLFSKGIGIRKSGHTVNDAINSIDKK